MSNFITYDQILISDRINFLKPSVTLQKNLQIQKLKANGKNIISLITGEPQFTIPNYIKKATIKAIQQNNNKYSSSSGLINLKQSIADKYNILCIKHYITSKVNQVKNIQNFNKEEDNNAKSNNKITQLGQIDISNKVIQLDELKNAKFNKEDIVISNGTKHSIFNLLSVLLNKDDEVIIPMPAWPSYIEIAKSLYANVKLLPFKKDFSFDINLFKNTITNKTKILILNSPNNPSGNIYTKEFLLKIIEILDNYPNICILIDEIYSDIIFKDKFNSLAILKEEMLLRIFIVNGFSKKYAMMGWRIGWIISKNTKIINAMITLQSQVTGNVCNIVQLGACYAQEIENKLELDNIKDIALNNNLNKNFCNQYCESLMEIYSNYNNNDIKIAKKFLISSQKQYKKALNISYKILSKNKKIKIMKPDGAFYLFCDISFFIKKYNKTSELICDEILYEYNVAVLSGTEFGASNHIRISIAGCIKEIEKGCNLLLEYFNKKLSLYIK
ncbi:MAG: aminotransferase class I/II-fold pyridoxal phosphate-dependent enzyme [Rickettsiales bacterium]